MRNQSMYKSCLFAFVACCNFLANILGCWGLQRTESISFDATGKEIVEYSERYNVLPRVAFFYNNEGIVSYSNGKKERFRWEGIGSDTLVITIDDGNSNQYLLTICDDRLIASENSTGSSIKRYILAKNDYSIEEGKDPYDYEISETDIRSSAFWNPCPKIHALIIRGYETSIENIEADPADYKVLYSAPPYSQKIVFLKKGILQTSFPCYLITYGKDSHIKNINYMGDADL